MSKRTRTFFDKLKEGAKEVMRDVVDEAARFVRQGSSELSSAIFQGHAYVPYGTGQIPTKDTKDRGEHGADAQQKAELEPESGRQQEREGREL